MTLKQGLEVAGLTHRERGLIDVSFRAEPGQILGVIGLNGCGKSTLVRCLSGELTPDAGVCSWNGERLTEANRATCLSVYRSEEWKAPRPQALLPAAWEGAAAEQLMERLRLKDDLEHFHSDGIRLTAALAAAILKDAPVLILEEPIVGIELRNQAEIEEVLREERSRGRAVILVTAMLAYLVPIGDSLLVLNEGQVVHDGCGPGGGRAELEEWFLQVVGE